MYLLCKTLCENGVADETGSDLFVVFISNEKKQARACFPWLLPMFCLIHYTVSCASLVNLSVYVSVSIIDNVDLGVGVGSTLASES